MKIITRTRKTGEYLGYYILEDNEEIKVQELEEELKKMKEQLEQTNRAVEDLALQNAGV